jgi:hypothetical protein
MVLGEDGLPRKTEKGENCFQRGRILEWVYGDISLMAEKARGCAKPLGRSSFSKGLICLGDPLHHAACSLLPADCIGKYLSCFSHCHFGWKLGIEICWRCETELPEHTLACEHSIVSI